jgi:hypothetical protein
MDNFDKWVNEKRINDAIYLYRAYKKRGYLSRALACLRQALQLRTLEQKHHANH